MWTLALSVMFSTAMAQEADCDMRALAKETLKAGPTQIASAFTALAACDEGVARNAAPKVFDAMVSGPDAREAILAGIKVGSHAEVLDWLGRQEPDVFSRAVSKLGTHCEKVPEIGAFFTFAHETKGMDFWVERWHRGMGDCRVPEVRELLGKAVDGAEVGRASRNTTQFYSLLEVYARNLGADAVPKLEEFLASAADEKDAVALVSVLSDAANVGGSGGPDAASTKAILEALDRLAPKLPAKSIDTVRTTLASLGKEDASSKYAQYRWPDAFSGQYKYGLSVTEDITCKNGTKRALLHHGVITEKGVMWPDAVSARVNDDVGRKWTLDNARKCKGTSDLKIELTPLPLGVEESEADWNRRILETFRDGFSGAKTWIVAEDGFGY